jgi:hypothetical protein
MTMIALNIGKGNSGMVRKETRLEVISPLPQTSIVKKTTPPGAPLFEGEDSEDLMCGSCGGIIAHNLSIVTARENFVAPGHVVIKCDCGAHNLIGGGNA